MRLPCVLALAMMVALAESVLSQQVEVQLREEGTRTVVVGAIVRLLAGSDDRVLDQGLTNEGGRLVLRAPSAGLYRLKVDRIGWVGVTTAPFELTSGSPLRQDIVLANVRLDLPTIEVEAESVCGREFGDQSAAAHLWLEVHRALTATVLSAREGIPLHMREYRRELAPNEREIRMWYTRSRIVRGRVYETLPPATLAREGFVLVDQVSDSTIYAVPDAALLVSNEFTTTHCFRTAHRPEAGLVGLAFEPVRGRSVTGIQGVLWLDRESHELRTLDYTYTGLPALPRRVDLGGQIDFERLPNGRWIVSRWHVRTPMVAQMESRRSVQLPGRAARPTVLIERLEGLVEIGGEVRIAEDPSTIQTHAMVVGRLVDPTTGTGLDGAIVTVEGVPGEVRTGADGAFAIRTELSGERRVTVAHPKLSVANHSVSVPALLSVGDTTTVAFSMPGSAVFVRAICGNPRNRSGVVGLVLGEGGTPLSQVSIEATWEASDGRTEHVQVRSGAGGRYGLCALPPDLPITLTATSASSGTRSVTIELGPRAYQWVDLVLKASEEGPTPSSRSPGPLER